MARSVIEIGHVELLGLEVDKIGLFFQSSKDFWLCEMRVRNLVVLVEQGEQFPYVIEVVFGDLRKAELVEVAKSHSGKREVWRRHLVQFGDVRKLKVVRHAVHAYQEQQTERAQKRESPQEATECHVSVGENVAHAVQRGRVGEGLQIRRPDALDAVLRISLHGCHGKSVPNQKL